MWCLELDCDDAQNKPISCFRELIETACRQHGRKVVILNNKSINFDSVEKNITGFEWEKGKTGK